MHFNKLIQRWFITMQAKRLAVTMVMVCKCVCFGNVLSAWRNVNSVCHAFAMWVCVSANDVNERVTFFVIFFLSSNFFYVFLEQYFIPVCWNGAESAKERQRVRVSERDIEGTGILCIVLLKLIMNNDHVRFT